MKPNKIPGRRDSSKIQSKNLINRGKIDFLNTHMHDRSFSWHGTGSSIKNSGVKPVR